MKSLFFALVLNFVLTLSLTACSSAAMKTEAPKAADEKAAPATPKTVVTKPVAVSKKAAKAVVAPTSSAGTMTCANGSDSRGIEIQSAGTGCELKYTKNGEAKSIASAKNESAYCAGVSEKLVKNLTAAGFSCK